MKTKLAINGFGRIGRSFIRIVLKFLAGDEMPEIDILDKLN
jgi:glyceraldehyde-3-phosphate dehydrogenase/erythrose-4-phosphate dehydrogenase